jgi:hypothetical protein
MQPMRSNVPAQDLSFLKQFLALLCHPLNRTP